MTVDTDYLRKTYNHLQRRADYFIRVAADEIDRLRRKDKISQDMIKQLVQMQYNSQHRRKAA